MADLPPDALLGLPENDAPVRRDEIEGALRFVNQQVLEGRAEHTGVAAGLRALADLLAEAGLIDPGAYEERHQRALAAARAAQAPAVELGRAGNKYGAAVPDIDCASLLPICQARCCTLTVCLSEQDLDERILTWDYGKPYQIRQTPDGYCMYSAPGTHRCTVYQHRPAVCRTYDCRQDDRIWVDFERRIPRHVTTSAE